MIYNFISPCFLLLPIVLLLYADIQSVFPMQGSLNGGTRLNININPNHTYNSSDIKVMVGGKK